ncbi:MAG: hypothetical protein JWO11_3530 [Nocardioides sp.]|nr:hypothetical protein [Nocardioides sp.]
MNPRSARVTGMTQALTWGFYTSEPPGDEPVEAVRTG